jgi:hypothetical protein
MTASPIARVSCNIERSFEKRDARHDFDPVPRHFEA